MSDPNRAIAGRIRLELAELARVAERACRIWAEVRPSPDDFLVDAVALNLHSFYAGLEHIFELVADRVDHALPSGPSWHQELLRQMAAELPGVRPAAVTVDLMDGWTATEDSGMWCATCTRTTWTCARSPL